MENAFEAEDTHLYRSTRVPPLPAPADYNVTASQRSILFSLPPRSSIWRESERGREEAAVLLRLVWEGAVRGCDRAGGVCSRSWREGRRSVREERDVFKGLA